MKVNVHGKDLTVSKIDEERIGEKLSFLNKYLLIDDDTTAMVIVKRHGNDIKLEITIPTKVGTLRSEVIDHEIRSAIDDSIDKLEDQLRRQKTRLSRRHREKLAKAFIDDGAAKTADTEPAKVKRVAVDALEVDEAILRMEMLGHSFFVYRDATTDIISVVYKREDGGYGVIEAV